MINKKFCSVSIIVFVLLSLFVGLLQVEFVEGQTSVFGKDTIGSLFSTIYAPAGQMMGSVFSLSTGASVSSISFYTPVSGNMDANVECVIYRASDMQLMGYTPQLSWNTYGDISRWRACTFNTPVNLAPGDYILAVRVLYAMWDDPDDGLVIGSVEVASDVGNVGQTFRGSGNGLVAGGAPTVWSSYTTSNYVMSIYASYTPTASFTVTYNNNNNFPVGSVGSGSVPVDSNFYSSGESVSVKVNSGGLAVPNYTFLGWATSNVASVADFAVSGGNVVPSSFVMPNGNVVLYAVWQENDKFSVTYHGNGADGGVVPVDSLSPYFGGSTVTVLNQGSLTFTDHTFLGWSTVNSDSAPMYLAGSTFTISGDTLLYAVWEYSPGVTPTVPPTTVVPSDPVVVVPSDVRKLDLRFGSDEVSVFGFTGYGLDEKVSGDVACFSDVYGGDVDVAFGFRVWLVGADGFERELTEGVPVAVSVFMSGVDKGFSGWVSGVWDCPDTVLVSGEGALRVVLYGAVDDGAYTVARAVFVSPVLVTDRLVGSVWTFNIYVDYGGSEFTVSWGGLYGRAGVGGVIVTTVSVFDLMFFKLVNLDFFGFVLTPYVAILGGMFYVIVWVAVLGAYYIWHGKVSVVLFIVVMFGSAGGVLFMFFPAPALILVWSLLAVGLGVLLFRAFR